MRESSVEPQRPVPTMKRSNPGLRVVASRGYEERAMGASLDAEWQALGAALRDAGRLVAAEGAPDSPRDRAEGYRYLTRFLAAGVASCVAHADPDQPVFGRMIDPAMPWGLDNPDCLYLQAAVRGGDRYRIHGHRGSAHHLDVQVNFGPFALGEIASSGTIDSIDGQHLVIAPDGSLEITLSEEEREGNHLRLAPNAGFVLVRQYFADWEHERPADLWIEREGAEGPIPA